MNFTVEQWSRDYASPADMEIAPDAPAATIEAGVEIAEAGWAPIEPPRDRDVEPVVFVDGVQRIDAWIWIASEGKTRPGICASYAAGAVRCDRRAEIVAAEIRRGLFSPAATAEIRTVRATYTPRVAPGETVEHLRHGVQEAMGSLEAEIATSALAGSGELLVLDGPIRAGQSLSGAIGLVKTHHARYLSDEGNAVVAALKPGDRTPLFVMATSWTRYSWYMRLPGGAGHDWAGIVRCEAPISAGIPGAIDLAGRAAAALPRFASSPQKDPRAPQNLYPIGGLERHLRHRLGDPAFLYRELLAAGSRPA